MDRCPCDPHQAYADCCGPLHDRRGVAKSAVQLMRSRYSAYARGLEDYVFDTWHASTRPSSLDLASSQEEWLGLEVVESGSASAERSWVRFIAYFRHQGELFALEERSQFISEDAQWRYVDGLCETRPVKRGRNERCVCGSGAKFKRCCGR